MDFVIYFVVNVANVNDAPVVSNAIPNQSLSEHFVTEDIIITSVFTDPDLRVGVASNGDLVEIHTGLAAEGGF